MSPSIVHLKFVCDVLMVACNKVPSCLYLIFENKSAVNMDFGNTNSVHPCCTANIFN